MPYYCIPCALRVLCILLYCVHDMYGVWMVKDKEQRQGSSGLVFTTLDACSGGPWYCDVVILHIVCSIVEERVLSCPVLSCPVPSSTVQYRAVDSAKLGRLALYVHVLCSVVCRRRSESGRSNHRFRPVQSRVDDASLKHGQVAPLDFSGCGG